MNWTIKTLSLFILLLLVQDSSSQTSTWTVQTLKEYTDQRFEAMQTAISKQENAYNDRFANTNEWRSSYDDLIKVMQRDYLPRSEYESLKETVTEIKSKQDKYADMKQGGNIVWAYVISGVSLLVAIFAIKDKVVKYREEKK